MEQRSIPMETLLPLLQLQMDHGTRASLSVTGVSMLPMLAPGRDKVCLEKCTRPFQSGDVILYRRENGSYILHRIVRVSDCLTCCGDNQWIPEKVEAEQVIARVVAFQRKGNCYDIHNVAYRIYVFLWVHLYSLRRPYIWLRRRLGKLRKACKQNK